MPRGSSRTGTASANRTPCLAKLLRFLKDPKLPPQLSVQEYAHLKLRRGWHGLGPKPVFRFAHPVQHAQSFAEGRVVWSDAY